MFYEHQRVLRKLEAFEGGARAWLKEFATNNWEILDLTNLSSPRSWRLFGLLTAIKTSISSRRKFERRSRFGEIY